MSRPRPHPDALARYAAGFNESLTLRFFGCTISFPEPNLVRATLSIRPEHRGGLGSNAVNGGILAAMFDLVIGCTSALVDPTKRTATMQLSMSFERPLTGDVLIADAWLDRAGSATAFSSAQIKNSNGDVCARCQGVVRLTNVPWTNDAGSPAIN